MQPFLALLTPGKVTFTVTTEATYDWDREAWAVPVTLAATQLLK
jgi:hypothetical protein